MYLILDFLLNPFWPQKPHKMKVPQEIRRRFIFDGLECAMLASQSTQLHETNTQSRSSYTRLHGIHEPCWIPFGMHVGGCLGMLEIIKTCIFNKYQIMILLPFEILVTSWSGSHFAADLNSILDPFCTTVGSHFVKRSIKSRLKSTTKATVTISNT